MSYYENRIKELEARIEQMAMGNRLKAIPVEAQLIDRIAELNKDNARLKAEVERLRKAGDTIIMITSKYITNSTLRNLSLREWQAAKEGKPSV